MNVPYSDQDFRPMKRKNASLPPGGRAERCWCGRLAKVMEVVDFSDKFGMKYFMCANYDHDPPAQTSSLSSRPAVYSNSMIKKHICMLFIFIYLPSYLCCSLPPCKWFHWIDNEQPDWARREVEEKQRRGRARFHEEQR